jgi:hypothetical protein
MRVIDEVFFYDTIADRNRDYIDALPKELQAAITTALTAALRHALHIQQPPER